MVGEKNPQPEAMAVRKKKTKKKTHTISLLGWRVIKPYIYNQSPNQESLPCHSNDPDLMSQLHSDE